jgi:predicted ferric reductase
MLYGVILVALYICIVVSPLLLVAFMRLHSPNLLVYEIARSFGLAGFVILAMQPVLAARLKWIERSFGMDVLSRFHRSMGVFVTVMMASHPILMEFGGGQVLAISQPWYIWVGRAGLALLLIHTLISLYSKQAGYSFEQWRRIHYALAPLIIIFLFVHSLETGDDLKLPQVQFLWVALLAASFAAYIYHKIIVPLRLRRHLYRVADVRPEAPRVWTVKLAPAEGGAVYSYQPGQFHFITFLRDPDLPVEEHHWTISSSPAQKEFISSTIKESGDFTATIGQTKTGDLALVQGPFGRFSYNLYPREKDFVFIAGGIGITPLMSMLRYMRDTKADVDVLLLYANRTEKDIVFRTELDAIEAGEEPRLKVVHILSDPEPGWHGETGYVDHEKIGRLVTGNLPERAFYVCGPPAMSTKVIEALLGMGVPYARIHTEIFSL